MRRPVTVIALAAAVALALGSATAARAATPRTTLPAVESEVMCVECGTPLSVSQSPVADQDSVFQSGSGTDVTK